MILIAGVYDPDIDRVKDLLDGYEFPAEQQVIDRAFAAGELTIPEWSKAVQVLLAEQSEPFGFGSAISAGFFSGYLTLCPAAEVIVVRSDPLVTVENTTAEGYDRWAITRGIIMGQNAIDSALHAVPHALIDMTQDPTDDEIRELLGQLEKAA